MVDFCASPLPKATVVMRSSPCLSVSPRRTVALIQQAQRGVSVACL